MMQGYTIRVAEATNNADGSLVGVQLGRLCIKHDISVSQVARDLGVTRQTIYSWFSGKSEPQAYYATSVRRMLEELTQANT
jgi:DNA-binding XRE family transcriptional regulator